MKNKIGVIIGRFQVHELHEAHIDLINRVLEAHDKIIVFLGVSSVLATRRNPLDFVTRKEMLMEKYGARISAIIPIHDNRSDENWSREVDKRIKEIFPTSQAILYGSRDSFIPHYKGQFEVKELETKVYHSGTEVRKNVAQKIISSPDFRAGAIYTVYNQYPIVLSAVDVAILNDQNEILLGRKPNEIKYRFIGGFVDVKDTSDYAACRREVLEETGATVEPYEFITSIQIDDWRYKNETDRKIMSRFYKARYIHGPIAPNDDICEIKWFKLNELTLETFVYEHKVLYEELMEKLNLK